MENGDIPENANERKKTSIQSFLHQMDCFSLRISSSSLVDRLPRSPIGKCGKVRFLRRLP